VRRFGHDGLRTFGVGSDLDRRTWLSVYRQLIAQGAVLPDAAHGGLALAPAATEILRGQREVHFRRDKRERTRERTKERTAAAAGVAEALDGKSRELWEALRTWRLETARRQDVPPYVIFHDSTLLEIARQRPSSLAVLGRIPGVGGSKLGRYGAALLAVVAAIRS